METPEDRASRRLKQESYEPMDKEEAKKRRMIAEIAEAIDDELKDKKAIIVDQAAIQQSEDETWDDTDPEKTQFYQGEEISE